MHFADAFEREFRIGRADVVMQQSVATFDLFEEELFGTLLNGATLLIPPQESSTTRRGCSSLPTSMA